MAAEDVVGGKNNRCFDSEALRLLQRRGKHYVRNDDAGRDNHWNYALRRDITAREIAEIMETVELCRRLSLQELAHTIAENLQWYRAGFKTPPFVQS